MSLIRCSNCNHEISDTIKKCIHCGAKIQKKSTRVKEVPLIKKENDVKIEKLKELSRPIKISKKEVQSNNVIIEESLKKEKMEAQKFKNNQNKPIIKLKKVYNKNILVMVIILIVIMAISFLTGNYLVKSNKNDMPEGAKNIESNLTETNNKDYNNEANDDKLNFSSNIENDDRSNNNSENSNNSNNDSSMQQSTNKKNNTSNTNSTNDISDLLLSTIAYPCPDGYEFSGHAANYTYECTKFIEKAKVEYTCNRAEEEVIDGMCVWIHKEAGIPTDGKCPDGFELNNGFCDGIYKTEANKNYVCSSSSYLINIDENDVAYCTDRIQNIKYNCPTGYILNGYTCDRK